MREHSLSLGVSLFSHMVTESPQHSVHCRAAAGDPKQVSKSYRMELELSVPLKPVQELLSTVKPQPVNLDTHMLKQSRFDAPEDKVCAGHFCQCSVQCGWWVPIATATLEAAYEFGPNPYSSSEQIPIPLCPERRGIRKSNTVCQLLQSEDGLMGFGS